MCENADRGGDHERLRSNLRDLTGRVNSTAEGRQLKVQRREYEWG